MNWQETRKNVLAETKKLIPQLIGILIISWIGLTAYDKAGTVGLTLFAIGLNYFQLQRIIKTLGG